ncbi:MAG: TetR/AcrR family transcriptional regulator [Anaerolineae bacterium]|nr:TetR/AcrR family transcriptional regulator [Anaerolineae bacterium]
MNRRDQIITVASRLFMAQGYHATSVRQIAEEVGCTEAALYYHFKEGKRELLETVVLCNAPDLIGSVETCADAASLYDFIVCFMSDLAAKAATRLSEKMRWLMAEFPKLTEDERGLLNTKHRVFRDALVGQIRRFVADEVEVQFIASTLVLTLFGYSHMVVTIDTSHYINVEMGEFITMLADRLARGR